MKYINVEKLKSELYKRIGKYDSMLHEWSIPEAKGKREEAFELLTFVESIQQEQSKVDLEEEYKEYVENDLVFSILVNRNVGLAIARHFYELGRSAIKEE